MRRWISGLLFLLVLLPDWALATTYWSRPAFDSLRNPLTYGTGDGSSKANAIAGFATIKSGAFKLDPGDTLCLPGNDEIFYGEQIDYSTINQNAGTAGNPITIKGCEGTKALLWSASDLTGDRSYTAAKVPINGAAYEWVEVATDIYRKRIDRRPLALWEDTTWLEPFRTGTGTNLDSIDALSEATIIATLPAGKWGNRNNGDSTYRIYYHSTVPGKNPTNTTIRSSAINLDTTCLFAIAKNYINVEDIEFRGHMSLLNGFALWMAQASHLNLTRLDFRHNLFPINLEARAFDISDIVLTDVSARDNEGVGMMFQGSSIGSGAHHTDRVTILGGEFSYVNGIAYNGTKFYFTDGDGIGIGHSGGPMNDIVIRGTSFVGNFNAAIFVGTTNPMNVTNLTVESVYMAYNRTNCFTEGDTNTSRVSGTLRFSGVVCNYTQDFSGAHFYGPALTYPIASITPAFKIQPFLPTPREIIFENMTLVGNKNKERFYLRDDVNNHIHLRNILFWNNPGPGTSDFGDIRVFAGPLDANDSFENIFFASAINQNRVLGTGGGFTRMYNSASDFTAFAAFLNCQNCVINVDPLLVSSVDFRPQLGSPLLQMGTTSATCHDVRAYATVCASPSDIGAYQTITGDPSDNSVNPPNITTTSLPGGLLTVAYGQQLGHTGGTAPHTWSLASGTLPTGVTLSAGGLLAGTPTVLGVFNFTAQVTDNDARTDTTPPALTITVGANPIVITTTALLSGNVNRAYSQSMTATGGNGSITWAVRTGTLPTGLSMNSAGLITGTPTVLGTSAFTVRATDSVGTTQDVSLSLTILAALVLSTPDPPTCPSTVLAPNVCWYVRPDTDGVNDLNYGAEDGTTYATAFDGMADIAGMAPGDTVCYPGSGEPFYESLDTTQAGKDVSGTNGHRITYQGCGTTKTLWWSARVFYHDHSYSAAKAVVTGAAYEWVALGDDVYRKKIEILPKMLWAGDTWIQPRLLYTMSETQILAALLPGEWGVRNNGDSTYRVYYRAATAAQSPAHVVMRTDLLAETGAFGHVRESYVTLKHIETRGHRSSYPYVLQIYNAHHVTFEDMLMWYGEVGVMLAGNSDVATTDILWKDIIANHNTIDGAFISPGTAMDRLTIDGGEYSYNGWTGTVRGTFDGNAWRAPGDSDGIGLGQSGGNGRDLVIKNIRADGNGNYGVYIGTSNPMNIVNATLQGVSFDGNVRGCFTEGVGADITGSILVSGVLCANSLGDIPLTPAMHFSSSTLVAPRTVIVQNSTFTGNHNASRIEFEAQFNGGWNRYTFRNLVFINNFSDVTGNDHGDLYSYTTSLIGGEVFDNLWFYSKPNTSGLFAEIGPTRVKYAYNVGGDLAAFVTATAGTNFHVNTDPLFLSATDFRTKPASPLRDTATVSPYCIDVRGRVCKPDHQTVGAYQPTSGDLR